MYDQITTETVELFMSCCLVHQENRKRLKTTGVVLRPILSREFNSCGQVDLTHKHAVSTIMSVQVDYGLPV